MSTEGNERIQNEINFLSILIRAAKEWRIVGECFAAADGPEQARDQLATLWRVSPELAESVLGSQFGNLTKSFVRSMEEQLLQLEAALSEPGDAPDLTP